MDGACRSRPEKWRGTECVTRPGAALQAEGRLENLWSGGDDTYGLNAGNRP